MKTKKRINLPQDELVHKNQAMEWWYFNGFLKGKHQYAFMTCLFRARKDKVKLPFISPFKQIYFSHTLLFDLTSKKLKKEVLPIVILSADSFKKKELFINYYFPLRKDFVVYEIARQDGNLKAKTRFFDLICRETKKPLLENRSGYIDLGEKSTHYYSYTHLETQGYVDRDFVRGIAWHDHQWWAKGFDQDAWVWFSLQMPDGSEIVYLDYGGKCCTDISDARGRQKSFQARVRPLGKIWKSPITGLSYELEWEIKIKNLVIRTAPLVKHCEVNFGPINYWEGPITAHVHGKKIRGFMELLLKDQPQILKSLARQGEQEVAKLIREFNRWRRK